MICIFVFSVCLTQATGLGVDGLTTSLLNPSSSTALPSIGLPNVSDLVNLPPNELTEMFDLQPETLLKTDELIRYYGFPCEVHTVVTQDGYIITLHRIPGNKNQTIDPKLVPFLLVHGTSGYANHFLANTPENSFPLLLAEAGFDVWLANCRGSINSRLHTTLNPYSDEYWEFSWDEIAELDLPAFIDYILHETGHEEVFYSGHSLGGALPFALGATRPEYMNKMRAIYALAPMGDLENTSLPLRTLAQSETGVKLLVDTLNMHDIKAVPQLYGGLIGKYLEPLVKEIAFSVVGPDDQEWNSSRTEVNLAHYFTSMAFNIIIHQAQMVNKTKFCKFDWGAEVNQKKYGQPTPPDYDISKIGVPSYLYYGENDLLCPKNNGQFLKDRLLNATMIRAGEFWNHSDFLWAKNAAKFYNYLIAFIKAFVK